MATKHKNIFTRNKPLLDIYSGLDHEGKEVEVREDAEQQVKYHEIVEALAAAGYHRAHMHTLSAFDKIVGGITWCIELCDIDVDVNLLFEENLTIGKKIALTEKIVNILPSMQCPHTIEPHQIQGLDFINIYPLIIWLIKHSDEFREAKEDELRRFAVEQFDKKNIFEGDRQHFKQQQQFLRNLSAIQDLYKPCRVRKHQGAAPTSQLELVNCVLAEYDQRAVLHTAHDEDGQGEGLEFLREIEKTLADPSSNTVVAERFDHLDATDDSEKKLHYDILQSELSGDITQMLGEKEREKYVEEIDRLTEELGRMQEEVYSLSERHRTKIEEDGSVISEKRSELKALRGSFVDSQGSVSDKDLKEMYSTLKSFSKKREDLQKIIDHKMEEYNKLEDILRSIRTTEVPVEVPLTAQERAELDSLESRLRGGVAEIRRALATESRAGLALAAALDERPAQAELLQYERRFMELLQQVAAKHKETKQFYTFHNTLYEIKLYTSKELTLLNSILENYDEAMSSSKKREQFMSQLESIVEWVKSTVKKVERKYQEERDRKSRLAGEYTLLLDIQRQYDVTLNKLAEERKKLKSLMARRKRHNS